MIGNDDICGIEQGFYLKDAPVQTRVAPSRAAIREVDRRDENTVETGCFVRKQCTTEPSADIHQYNAALLSQIKVSSSGLCQTVQLITRDTALASGKRPIKLAAYLGQAAMEYIRDAVEVETCAGCQSLGPYSTPPWPLERKWPHVDAFNGYIYKLPFTVLGLTNHLVNYNR